MDPTGYEGPFGIFGTLRFLLIGVVGGKGGMDAIGWGPAHEWMVKNQCHILDK